MVHVLICGNTLVLPRQLSTGNLKKTRIPQNINIISCVEEEE